MMRFEERPAVTTENFVMRKKKKNKDNNIASVVKRWRRGQDSNLHSLSAGGFQDRCTTIMRPLPEWLQEYSASAEFGSNSPTSVTTAVVHDLIQGPNHARYHRPDQYHQRRLREQYNQHHSRYRTGEARKLPSRRPARNEHPGLHVARLVSRSRRATLRARAVEKNRRSHERNHGDRRHRETFGPHDRPSPLQLRRSDPQSGATRLRRQNTTSRVRRVRRSTLLSPQGRTTPLRRQTRRRCLRRLLERQDILARTSLHTRSSRRIDRARRKGADLNQRVAFQQRQDGPTLRDGVASRSVGEDSDRVRQSRWRQRRRHLRRCEPRR